MVPFDGKEESCRGEDDREIVIRPGEESNGLPSHSFLTKAC
jgi:hypothetical protein